MSAPKNLFDWAALYVEKGWQIVPLASGGKECKDAGWTKLKFRPDDFQPDDNIGIRSVDGIVVIDEDCPEAVACADLFLPPTRAIYGRPSKPRSKRLYKSTFEKTIAFKDTETGQTLLEIRSQHQDMAPPSQHPGGEVLAWEVLDAADDVDPAVLLRAGRLNATCALISRYYNPAGSRHDWCLALSGTLRQLGMTEEECKLILQGASKWANDDKYSDRLLEIRSTFGRPDDDPIKGARSLMELMDRGKTFLASLNKIWGSSSSAFLLNAKGDQILANNQENIRRALEKMQVTVSFDVFAQKPYISWGKFTGVLQDGMCKRLWLDIDKAYHFRPNKEFFFDVIQDMAERNPFHPVLDYLSSLKWDGVPRVNEWLIRSGRAADTDYVRAVSALFLIAAVRRVTNPGCKFDEMIVLESGVQGLQKSTALRTLVPNDLWFSDDLPLNVDAKQIVERTIGKWIIEASDLSGMSPSKVEHLKAMLSRQVDGPVRMAYARLAVEQKRQFVIAGTTNSYNYLTDLTGNRRFWPIRIEIFDIPWIREHRDQLWAEAYHREQSGESIRLSPDLYAHAEMQQKRRVTGDPWEPIIDRVFPDDYQRIAPDEIWEALGIPVERRDARGQQRIAQILQSLGYQRMTVNHEGRRMKGWGRGTKVFEPFNPNKDEV